MALEAQAFGMPQKIFPKKNLIQKIWNKVKYLQGAMGITEFSSIWSNNTYLELAKLQYIALWRRYGIVYLRQIFHKSETPPTVKVWVAAVRNTIQMEKLIYQHRGCSHKYEKLWDPWLDFLGGSDHGQASGS